MFLCSQRVRLMILPRANLLPRKPLSPATEVEQSIFLDDILWHPSSHCPVACSADYWRTDPVSRPISHSTARLFRQSSIRSRIQSIFQWKLSHHNCSPRVHLCSSYQTTELLFTRGLVPTIKSIAILLVGYIFIGGLLSDISRKIFSHWSKVLRPGYF